jgi:hypothetical protein
MLGALFQARLAISSFIDLHQKCRLYRDYHGCGATATAPGDSYG